MLVVYYVYCSCSLRHADSYSRAALSLLQWGVPKIHVVTVIASREGLRKITETHPDVDVTVGVVDEVVNERGEVLPGLGDSGDRQFGTALMDDDEYLMHPSKRKRSDA